MQKHAAIRQFTDGQGRAFILMGWAKRNPPARTSGLDVAKQG
jgi:hypothetical protein